MATGGRLAALPTMKVGRMLGDPARIHFPFARNLGSLLRIEPMATQVVSAIESIAPRLAAIAGRWWTPVRLLARSGWRALLTPRRITRDTLVLFLCGALGGLQAGESRPPAVAAGCTWIEGAIVRGPVETKRIALVFTGHEFAEGASIILDALARRGAPASFFLTGAFLDNPSLAPIVRRIVAEGHYLGPHSDQHLLLCDWSPSKARLVSREVFVADLETNRRKMARFTSAPVRWFLPPYEHYDAEIARWTEALGLRLVNFTSGTRSAADYTGEAARNFVASEAIARSILDREQSDPHGLNGFLLLLHLGAGPERADKMHLKFAALLEELSVRGYRFVRLDALLGAKETGP